MWRFDTQANSGSVFIRKFKFSMYTQSSLIWIPLVRNSTSTRFGKNSKICIHYIQIYSTVAYYSLSQYTKWIVQTNSQELRNLANTTFSLNRKSHYARTWCTRFGKCGENVKQILLCTYCRSLCTMQPYCRNFYLEHNPLMNFSFWKQICKSSLLKI